MALYDLRRGALSVPVHDLTDAWAVLYVVDTCPASRCLTTVATTTAMVIRPRDVAAGTCDAALVLRVKWFV
jgi:hypothetical protein